MNDERLKLLIGSNIAMHRKRIGLTQAGLAGKLNYSDKAISKWERAEGLPDVIVVKSLADLFGVSVDFMLGSHDQWQPAPLKARTSTSTITGIVQLGIWAVAILLFVIFWIGGRLLWIMFPATLPVSLITLLVLNSVWGRRRYNLLTVIALVLSLIGLLWAALPAHPWQLWLLAIPALPIVWLSFHIRRKQKEKTT